VRRILQLYGLLDLIETHPIPAYVDTNLVGSGKIAKAAILGLAGGVWASSAGYTVRKHPHFVLNVSHALLFIVFVSRSV
jgi:hypothetical protein